MLRATWLTQILSSFIQILTPFFCHGNKDLKGSFDDKVKEENKDIDTGKFAWEPFAGGDDRDIEEAPEEGKNSFFGLDDN